MKVLYELWLHAICKFEPDDVAKAAPFFENMGGKFSSPEIDLQKLKDIGIAGEFATRFSNQEFFKEAINIIKYCEDNGIRIISQESEEYPEILKNIDIPPRLLFAKGEKLDMNEKIAVSVVGCRKPTDQGKIIANGIGRNLAENGIISVSGMAEGIDAEAHWGTIRGGGKTIAVLAGSVDEIYPKCNAKLYHEIIKNGTVISERPPRTITKRYFYRQRNRIVVGLSRGTVFVEGEEKSGTSMTARLALENNRDIFAVPRNILNWQSELPNRLVDEGAIPVNKIETPMQYYREQNPEFFKKAPVIAKRSEGSKNPLTEDERILNLLAEKGTSLGLEEIAETLGIAINILNGRLTILCIKGAIRQESGNRYILVK